MREIEVKVFNIDKASVIPKLINLNADKIFDGPIISYIYQGNKALKIGTKLLRLRRRGKDSLITYKEMLSGKDARVSEEIELNIDDFDKMDIILNKLGFSCFFEVEKTRASYCLEFNGERVLVEFDKHMGKYSRIPEFFEIEAPSEKTINKLLEYLEIDKSNVSKEVFFDLVKRFC